MLMLVSFRGPIVCWKQGSGLRVEVLRGFRVKSFNRGTDWGFSHALKQFRLQYLRPKSVPFGHLALQEPLALTNH